MKTQLMTLFTLLVCPAFAAQWDESALDSARDQGARQIESTSYVAGLQKKLGEQGFHLRDRRTFVLESSTDAEGLRVQVIQLQQYHKPVLTPVTHARPDGKVVYWSTSVLMGYDGVAKPSVEKHVRPVRFQSKAVNVDWKTEQTIQKTLASPKITEGLKLVILAKVLAVEPEVKAILEHPYDGQGKNAYELAQWIFAAPKGEYLRDIITGYFAL